MGVSFVEHFKQPAHLCRSRIPRIAVSDLPRRLRFVGRTAIFQQPLHFGRALGIDRVKRWPSPRRVLCQLGESLREALIVFMML